MLHSFPTSGLLLVFAISLSVSLAVLAMKPWLGRLARRRDDLSARQAAHRDPTPRFGGVGIIVAMLLSVFVISGHVQGEHALFALSVLPVFLVGLAEDVGLHASPKVRLLAAAGSGLLAAALLGIWLPRAEIPGFDIAMQFAPVAIAFTVFTTAGVCNAFNLIDGVNGLSAGTALLTALGLGAIATLSGVPYIGEMNLLLAAALAGFLVLNYPFGKIFLGDAGAYSIGHFLSWCGIILVARSPEVSTWAIFLVFFWPVADTFRAIYRRAKLGHRADQPDRLHYHQLVMRALEITRLGRDRRHVANPLVLLILLPFILAPIVTGVMLWNRPLEAFLACLLFGALFAGSYSLGLRLARSGRLSRRREEESHRPGDIPVIEPAE